MAFITDSVRAQNAFNTALDQAKYTTRDLFTSFGITQKNPNTGQYTTTAAGDAFSPANIVTFNEQTGVASVNQAALEAAKAGEMGTAFGYNRMSQTMGTGASREAAAMAALRNRGIAGGGLARQTQAAAEASQTQEQAGLISELLSSLGGVYGSTTEKFGDWMTSRIDEAGTAGQTVSETNASSPVKPPSAPAKVAPKKGDKRVSGGWNQYWNGNKWVSTSKVKK